MPLINIPVDDGPVEVLGEGLLGRRRQQRERLVGHVQLHGGVAVDVEPPVADEGHLAEDGAVGAQEGVLVAVLVAVVPYLMSRGWGGLRWQTRWWLSKLVAVMIQEVDNYIHCLS